MALAREKKTQVIDEVTQLLQSSKLTVMASYSQTTVAELQSLRHQARQSNTKVKVIKNRLFMKVLESAGFDMASNDGLSGQLIYLFNDSDEVAPAQEISKFAKTHPQVKFVTGITADGNFISTEDLEMLASLPSRDQLRGQLVGLINAPLQGTVSVIGANIRGLLSVLSARSATLESK